jgi:ATP-dependent helicase HrpA
MLLHDQADEVRPEDFPDEWREGALTLPLSYQFEPGTSEDGVRVDVPLATLNHLGATPFSWHVPGLREELVVALIRSLPKNLRVNFVPAPNVARQFLAAVPPGEEPLTEALSRYLRATTGVHVPQEAWDWDKVPGHLRPTFRVVDEAGRTLGEGKDLDALKAPLRPSFENAMKSAAAESGLTATGQRSWTFGDIERSFTQLRAGHEVRGHPGLVDEGDTVGLRVFASEEEQLAQHRRGVRRLLVVELPTPELLDALSNADKLALAGSPYPNVKELAADCVLNAVDQLLESSGDLPWSEAEYTALRDRLAGQLPGKAAEVLQLVLRILALWRDADRQLQGRVAMAALPSMTDLQAHLARLVHRGFVGEVGAQLVHFPRYLQALMVRRERLDTDPARDRQLMAQVAEFQDAWQHRTDALPEGRPPGANLERLRWLIEEYRVSLWAQQLGTAQPVSDGRLRKLLG